MGMICTKLLIDEPGENRTAFLKNSFEQVMSEMRYKFTAVRLLLLNVVALLPFIESQEGLGCKGP